MTCALACFGFLMVGFYFGMLAMGLMHAGKDNEDY